MFDILDVGSLRVGILRDLHVRSQRLEDLEVLLAARPHSMHGRQKVLFVDGCSVSGGAGHAYHFQFQAAWGVGSRLGHTGTSIARS